MQQAFAIAGVERVPRRVFLSLDDSLTDKDNGSRCLQMVDWFFDHAHSWPNHPIYTRANVYVMLRLTIGSGGFTIDMAPYLQASTCDGSTRRVRKDSG